MIKTETLGMLDVAKINPVLVSETDVVNNQFFTHEEDLYLISNVLGGDDAYLDDATIKAGEYLDGYLVKAWEGQKLVIDGKHIVGDYATFAVEGTVLVANADGKLEVGEAPAEGVYFTVTDKCTLTEKAVKAKVCVA